MNKAKKIVASALCVALGVSTLTGLVACENRAEVLKIYNWTEYMDPEVYENFETWYEEQTGQRVVVKETTFDANESAYANMTLKNLDYDLFCPSDYLIDQMRKENWLKEIDTEIFDMKDYLRSDILQRASAFDPGNKYAMPFMYGTFGILYDTNDIDYGTIDSWSALFTDTYSKENNKRIYMKKQVRDSFAVANIYSNRDKLSELSNGFTAYTDAYQTELQRIFGDTSREAIESARTVLNAQKPLVYKYDVDNGKFEMANATASAGNLGLFWSCDAGYVMNDYEDSMGNIQSGNRDIFYAIPKEGSNVYIDAFVIPKNVKNYTAANYFLKYLCETEIAYANMSYIGSTTPVASAYDEYKAELEEAGINDEGSFFNIEGKDDAYKTAYKQMYLDMMFPSDEILARCAVMTSLGDAEQDITQMFLDIQG